MTNQTKTRQGRKESSTPREKIYLTLISSAVNAEVARGKAGGLYIEQKIIKTGKLEDMSEQELETRMKEIVDQYSPILDAKPIEDLKREVRTRITPLKVVKEIPDDLDSEKETDDKPDQDKTSPNTR